MVALLRTIFQKFIARLYFQFDILQYISCAESMQKTMHRKKYMGIYSHERELLAKFPFTFRGYVILQAADSMVSISTEIYSILDPPADSFVFDFYDCFGLHPESSQVLRLRTECVRCQSWASHFEMLAYARRGVRGSQVPRLWTECAQNVSDFGHYLYLLLCVAIYHPYLLLVVAICCYSPSLFIAICCYSPSLFINICFYLFLFTVFICCYLLLCVAIHRSYLLLFVALHRPYLFLCVAIF